MKGQVECPICHRSMSGCHRDWLYKCDTCGLLASSLEPSIPGASSVTRLDETTRLAGLRAARRASNKTIIEFLKKELPTGRPRVLDVGCGHGLFMLEATEAGLDVEGIEPDANVVGIARDSTGRPVHHGYFPRALAEYERYDAIVFNDVLEHIRDVAGALAASCLRLNEGGILVLNCPDQRGIFYRIGTILDRVGMPAPFARLWQIGLPSPHVWYFSAPHLVRLGAGLKMTHLKTVRLIPVSREGLRERVTYVKGQSALLAAATVAAATMLIPFLKYLPKDVSIVFLRKTPAKDVPD